MATYYWVGGNGTWNNSSTANWAILSGGPSGFGPPVVGDTANFDANSGTSATVSIASTAAVTTLNLNKADLTLSLGGNFTVAAGFVFTTGIVTLNNNTFTIGAWSSANTNSRTVNFGTGKIVVTLNNLTIWNMGTSDNLTVTGTPVVELSYSGATGTRTIVQSVTSGGTDANSISFKITAGTDIVTFSSSANTNFKNVDFTGFSGTFSSTTYRLFGSLTLSTGMTITAGATTTTFAGANTATVTSNGKTYDRIVTVDKTSGTLQLQDNLTMGSTRTFTLTAGTLDLTGNSGNWTLSTGVFSSSNANTRSIAFGTGNITVTANGVFVWTTQNSTGFSYTGTPTVNLTYAGSVGTRSIGMVTAATEANALNFNISAGTDILAFSSGCVVKNLNFTGFSGTWSSTTTVNFYGNLVISTGMSTSAGTSAMQFLATSGTQQITTASKTLDFPLIFNGIGGTFAFQDALTQGNTRAFTITNGTVQLKAGTTNTVGSFATSGTNVKYLQSTTAGTQATISDTVGITTPTYLNVKDISAQGGAIWNAYTVNNNVNASNNSGWNFGGNFMPMFG